MVKILKHERSTSHLSSIVDFNQYYKEEQQGGRSIVEFLDRDNPLNKAKHLKLIQENR